jgi:hypothetical protein
LLQTPNINHNTKHLKRIEHDIDDILEWKIGKERPRVWYAGRYKTNFIFYT